MILLIFSAVIIFIIALHLTEVGELHLTEVGEAAAASRYQVSVWYPGWGTAGTSDYEAISGNASTIDQVNPFWYALRADGSLAPYEWAEDQKLVALASEKGILVMPLISNEFDPARVHRVLSTQAERDAHAAKLTELVMSKGYAGLDLDYEMLYASDRAKFSLFVENLGSRLHAKGKKLSIVVHAKTSEPGSWSGPQGQDWQQLGRAVDQFKIMTYDYYYNGSQAGPASPPEWIDQVLSFAESQVAPYKIRMGLPFYGRDWVGNSAKDLVYAEVQDLISKHGSIVYRSSSREPYLFYRDALGTSHTVYFQDQESIEAKLDVFTSKHPSIGGVSIWHVGGESPEYWISIRNKLSR